MKFIELFAGIGGFRLGLERAGHECVWSNEIVEKARSIYEHNFKDAPDGRDIRTIQPDEIPDCDLLVGGFPCATFSVAGRRTGFGTEDTRGTLFFEICRILSSKRIPYVFLENVKGLLNHDGGRTFGVIIASLDELGYDIQWECVNSKNFGVPQNRERIFIVGNLRGHPRPEVFPIGRCFAEDAESSEASQGEGERVRSSYLPTLDAHYYKGGGTRAVIDEGHASDGHVRATHWRRNHFRDVKGNYTPTLTANMGTGGNNVPYIVKAVLTPDRKSKRQNGRRIKEQDEPAFTLTAQDRHGVQVGSQLRKLTPMECERLQSLPDNWTKWYRDGSLVSDNQRYERCGRAVTVNVIYEIAKRLPV
jgi:DNA (cytosine-5)-methyltransferase 1